MNSAPPSQKGRDINLDFLRGIAILGVIGDHTFGPPTQHAWLAALLYPFALFGARGVDLFFVLSGFLVGGLLLKQYRAGAAVDARRFLVRRMFKIWPAYYALILVHLILRRHPPSSFLWQNMFHVQNYFPSSISQTWSLAIEEHFYLALAFFFYWASRRRWSPERLLSIFAAVCAVSLIWRYVDVAQGNLGAAIAQTQNRMDNLVFGVAAALLYWMRPDRFDSIARRKWTLLVLTVTNVFLLAWTPFHPAFQVSIGFTLTSIGFTAMLVLVFRHGHRFHGSFLYRAISWVGLYSYGIYLWHSLARDPSLNLVSRLHIPFDAPNWICSVALQFAAMIAFGYVMTRIIEYPFLKLRDRLMPAPEPLSPRHGLEATPSTEPAAAAVPQSV